MAKHSRDGPTLIAGRYQLESELARGGMGTIWVGLDKKLGRKVAVKIMASELAQMSEALQRFEREATSAAQLRSVHVVEVYDYGTQENVPFIVMEYLDGENLGDRLKRLGRFGLRDTAMILGQVSRGLRAAHAAGLVHRDLKPSNIFLARNDDLEVVKLLDFGVVKAVDRLGNSEMTATGVLLGTPQYMSPEQARGTKSIDRRSDLWSVAVILFRMLTGVNPFQGETVGDVVLKICSDALPKISEHAADLPRDLDGFFARAFARNPDGRYQTADELATAFIAICRQQHPDLSLPGTAGNETGEYASPLMRSSGGMLAPVMPPRDARPATVPMPHPSQPSFSGPQLGPHGADASALRQAPPQMTATGTALVEDRGEMRAPLPSGSMPSGSMPSGSTPSGSMRSGVLPHVPPHEPTPVSTTVGGTPLPSGLPPRFYVSKKTQLYWAVGGGALLLLGGVSALVLFRGGDERPPSATAATSAADSRTSGARPGDGRVTDPVPGASPDTPVINMDDVASAKSASSAQPAPSRPVQPPAGKSPKDAPPPPTKQRPKWF